MRLRVIILYIVGVILLIFGNKNLWNGLQREREEGKKARRAQNLVGNHIKNSFEVQTLRYDSVRQQWINPHVYFQLVNASYVNFSNENRGKRTTIETAAEENASDSQ